MQSIRRGEKMQSPKLGDEGTYVSQSLSEGRDWSLLFQALLLVANSAWEGEPVARNVALLGA